MLYEIILNPLKVFFIFREVSEDEEAFLYKARRNYSFTLPTYSFVCTDKRTAEGKLSGRIRQIKSSAHASGLAFLGIRNLNGKMAAC